MSERVDLFRYWADDAQPAAAAEPVRLVRLDANELPVVPFTSDTTPVKVHYCDQPEVRGYVRCNGQGCVLCLAGREPDERLLLPVYLPTAQSVAVLPLSRASYPGALLPQVKPALQAPERCVLLIRKSDRTAYRVKKIALRAGLDDGAQAVAQFQQRWQADEVDLAAAYLQLDNRDLAQLPGVAAMLRLKGIKLEGEEAPEEEEAA